MCHFLFNNLCQYITRKTHSSRTVNAFLFIGIIFQESYKLSIAFKAIVTAVKSWLHHFDIEVKRKIKIANADSTPSLANERVPDDIELKELFNRANLRTGAIMALIGKAGLRPEVLGKHDASDGLMIRDLPELDIVLGIARFQAMPPKVLVRKTLSKAGHSYFTFITESGAEKVLAYLNERLASGEALTAETGDCTVVKTCNVPRKTSRKKIHDNISDRATSKKSNETKVHVETVCVADIL